MLLDFIEMKCGPDIRQPVDGVELKGFVACG